jgi:hypothetical protein
MGKIAFQFKSFAVASNHRMLMTSIDDMTAQKMIGIATMVFFGHLANSAKRAVRGEEQDDRDWNSQLGEAIAASGVPALFLEADNILELVTSGKASIMAGLNLRDTEKLQYQQRATIPEYLLGPTAGLLGKGKHIATAFASGQWRESDVKALRRSIPLNNWAPIYIPVNMLEEQIIKGVVE